MTVNELLNYFDNWNMNIVINSSKLDNIYKNKIVKFWEERNSMLRDSIYSFGVYDNDLCIRLEEKEE